MPDSPLLTVKLRRLLSSKILLPPSVETVYGRPSQLFSFASKVALL
jgi:hypothetical protein